MHCIAAAQLATCSSLHTKQCNTTQLAAEAVGDAVNVESQDNKLHLSQPIVKILT